MQTRVLSKVRVGAGESGVQGGFAESCFHDKVLARLKGKLPTIMRTLTGGELGWEEREEINARRARMGKTGGH